MQQERDILQYSVFPRIREFAKQYGRHIDLCDLRWGVNSIGMGEEESTAKVLQVCFDEIDHAHPFFIAILGDRYGWVPNADIVTRSVQDKTNVNNMLGKSVTEMEILYSARQKENAGNMRFYFREITNKRRGLFVNADLPKAFISETVADKMRMKELKKRISSQFPGQVRTYRVAWNNQSASLDGMEPFAEMLYQDIRELIVRHWGPAPQLSAYEQQFYQYQYTIDSDSFAADTMERILNTDAHPDNLLLNEPVFHKQNYVLVSPDEQNLNLLYSDLCKRYRAGGCDIFPYECSQSVISSSTENMLAYFSHLLEKRFGGTTDAAASSPAQFQALLFRADAALERPLILAVRNLQYLDYDNFFEWLPTKPYRNIRFLLSCNRVFPGPSQFKEHTLEFYFPDNCIFSRSHLIRAYMAHNHKELDEQVYHALLEKAEDKDDHYLRLLMQRLLLLSRSDYEKIKKSGDGIEAISRYLQEVISAAPNHTADFISEQLTSLEAEIGQGFVKAVLAVLAELPYGISRGDLQGVLAYGNVNFSTLNMTLLCRSLASVVNVTLEGNYRMMHTPAAQILTDILVAERAKWRSLIERYMSDTTESESEFYRSQYLELGLKCRKATALADYLERIGHDVPYVVLILNRLAAKEDLRAALVENGMQLAAQDVRWFAVKLYTHLADQKYLLNKAFAIQTIELWKSMLSGWSRNAAPPVEMNEVRFQLLYALGEMSHFHDLEDAERYLLEAKKLAKENFKKYPNRLWKMLNGIELTEEEKRMGYDALSLEHAAETDSIMFGFHGEIEDMTFEQSWSPRVRVINNYLAQIYRKRGDIQSAAALEDEAKRLTHISDPDPKNKGITEVAPGVSVLWPEDLEPDKERSGTRKKRTYMPDMRRNSAIQIAKEAHNIQADGDLETAMEKFMESNRLLEEIYEDGETGEFYDLDGVVGDPEENRIRIQKECARDISLNLKMIVRCLVSAETNAHLTEYLDDMLSWAHIYDDYRNNRQSKSDLEEAYLLCAAVYEAFGAPAQHGQRIVRDIDRYFTYRLEAHMKGEQTDESILRERREANAILCQTVFAVPQLGSQITDLLLSQSNASVKANDFDGFILLTHLMEDLLSWMWEHDQNWAGTYCSLELIFFSNMNNQTMLWEKHRMPDRLEADAKRLCRALPHAREADSVLMGSQSILRHAMEIFRTGDYRRTLPYADAIYDALQRSNSLPDVELVSIREKLTAMYSEAGVLEKARLIATQSESQLDRMLQAGYTRALREANITPTQYHFFVFSKMIIFHLNHAIIFSRMENQSEAESYLRKAEALTIQHPDVAASEPGLTERIALFKAQGLPRPKQDKDAEKIYRQYKTEIEVTLSRCLRNKHYDITTLQHITELIQKMCAMPEHAIFKSTYTIAKYYHVLNMLFASLQRRDLAFEMLQKACEIASSDDDANDLYADIYSDMCGYVTDPDAQYTFIQRSLAVYETLQKEGREYSRNSYAMALYNAAVILLMRKQYAQSLERVRKAIFIWETMYETNPDDQTKEYLSEANRIEALAIVKKLL